ncbi:MAG TPA: hypothetical protein VIJ20_09730 [Solirubrobacteraceae bacterium]
MLVTAVVFWEVILAVHIAAVLVTFGVTFAYPLIYLFAAQLDPRAMPWYYRTRRLLGQRLISPGLVLVLAAGIYLASDLHQWKLFYVQWGIGIVVVIGALSGAFYAPREKKLAALAERDIAGAGAGPGPAAVSWSAEYLSLARRVAMVDWFVLALILITVYVMTIQAG